MLKNGSEVTQVDEPLTTFIFELDAYPEPKCLSAIQLNALYQLLGTNERVARLIGTSTNFVREKTKKQFKPKGDK